MTRSVMTITVDTSVKTEPFRQLAGKAADYIRERAAASADGTGWCQGEFERDGKVCMGEAQRIERERFPAGTYADLHAYIEQAVGASVVRWNDHPDRTESEVLGVLDAISEGWL